MYVWFKRFGPNVPKWRAAVKTLLWIVDLALVAHHLPVLNEVSRAVGDIHNMAILGYRWRRWVRLQSYTHFNGSKSCWTRWVSLLSRHAQIGWYCQSEFPLYILLQYHTDLWVDAPLTVNSLYVEKCLRALWSYPKIKRYWVTGGAILFGQSVGVPCGTVVLRPQRCCESTGPHPCIRAPLLSTPSIGRPQPALSVPCTKASRG